MTRKSGSRGHALAALASLCLAAGLLFSGSAAAAAELQLRVSREPYYVGLPIDLHVQATGLEKEPQPSCEVDPPERGTLRLLGIVPNFSSSVRIINGRVLKSETATFTCQYQFSASQPGDHRVGPFRMTQGGVALRTEPYSIRLEEVPLDPRLRIRLLVPDQPVYLGQHLPIRIEWWLAAQLQDRIRGYSIRSDLFQRDDTFDFAADETPRRGEQSLEIETSSGTITLAAKVEKRRHDNRDFLVIVAERTLIPLRAGEFALGSASVNVEEVTRWQRDLFGGRRPAGTGRLFSRDEARSLVVAAAPLEDRPNSFAGAVGKGFSLEVSADRSVVQLGDPIALTLSVRGDGNLAGLSLPSFGASGELDPEHFHLPEGEVPGRLTDDAKVFRLSLRVLDEAVSEIPALSYSWFDPELEQYQTTRSRPIALSVRPAEVISADDVVSPIPAAQSAPDARADGDADAPETGAQQGGFSLTGADLSLEQKREKLLQRSHARPGLQIAAYAGSITLLLAALWARRRSEVNPDLRRRREVYRQQRKRIAAAGSQPRREAMTQIAAALREIVAVAPELRSPELDDLVRECDSVIYAPAGETATGADAQFAERARSLLDRMRETLG